MSIIPFTILSVAAIVFALLLVLTRNAVHGALCLVLNFGVLAVFFLLLSADFIAVVQVAVYAGAIMVLFLFVLMLLNVQGAEEDIAARRKGQVTIAVILGALLLLEVGLLAPRAAGINAQGPEAVTAGFGTPQAVGLVLFNEYMLAFQVTAFVLLAAMMGAVVLAKRRLS